MYRGVLDRTKMRPLAKKAYVIWIGQRDRCNNPNNSRHEHYGDKGIRVEYSSREFIGWYLKNFPKKMNNPSVGRIDHSKNYSLDNIEFQELKENSSESINRNEINTPRQVVRSDGKLYSSLTAAAADIGVLASSIHNTLSGRQSTCRGFSFAYAEVDHR